MGRTVPRRRFDSSASGSDRGCRSCSSRTTPRTTSSGSTSTSGSTRARTPSTIPAGGSPISTRVWSATSETRSGGSACDGRGTTPSAARRTRQRRGAASDARRGTVREANGPEGRGRSSSPAHPHPRSTCHGPGRARPRATPQALRYLGPQHVTTERVARLRRTLTGDDRRALLRDLPLAPTWMHRTLKDLAAS